MTATYKHSVRYTDVVLSKDTLLLDYDSPHNDWFGYNSMVVPKGSKLRCRVEQMEDGRTYYTVFQWFGDDKPNLRLYSTTAYREKPGAKVEENIASAVCHGKVKRNQ